MEFSRQEYWIGFPFPSPGDLPDLGIEPMSPASPASAGGFFTAEPPGTPHAQRNFPKIPPASLTRPTGVNL